MIYFEVGKEDLKIAVLQKCIDFLDSEYFPKDGGAVELGNGIRCIVSQYTTLPEETALWEAHKKYVDLHYLLEGEEKIRVAFTSQSEAGEYHEEDDYLELNGKAWGDIYLKTGCALCLFPNDAHQVKVQLYEGQEISVTKVVFKIPLELF